MDLDAFRGLLAPAGQAALAAAARLGPTDAAFLPCYEKLRKAYPAALAKAAVETIVLRARARGKFADADRMYFQREALEQASGSVVAAYRAGRFAGFEAVADLGCGIGGDTLGLAGAVPAVEAVDTDPLRLAIAEANAAACGYGGRVHFREADILTMPPPAAGAAFADPSRRAGGRRFLSLSDYLPPPAAIRARFPPHFPLAVKVAPGVARRDLLDWDAEAEFLSIDGELKECVLWCGPLRSALRRATVLPSRQTLSADAVRDDARLPAEPGGFLFDPDPSVVRAELEHQLAERLDAGPVDSNVALFTGPAFVASPFAACYRVLDAFPFHPGRLRDYLRERRVGRVTLLKRASDVDADELMRKLKLDGPEHRTVVLTRSLGRPAVFVVERDVRQSPRPDAQPE